MAQTIDGFAKQNIQLARIRGLTPRNPINLLFRPNANDTTDVYIVVVADTEPSFSDLPYNLIWVVSNKGDPQFQAVLRRTSHVSDGMHRGSWVTITNYNDLFNSRQIYRRVVENASSMGIDPGDVQLSKANTSKAGTVLLAMPSPTPNTALVVSDSDPRMADSREPTDHDHEDYPRTKIHLNPSQYVEINSSNSPQEGYVLAIVDVDPTNPNKFIGRWVKPTMDNVVWTSPRLLALRLSLPGAMSYMSDNSEVQMVCTAEWSDRVAQNPPGVEWSIEDNALGVTISPTGVVTAPDLGFDVTLTVRARMQDPVYGNWVETEYPLLIKDLYLENDTLVRITITGADTMFSGQREVFSVTAHYASGSKVPILPLDFTSNNPYLVLSGLIGEAKPAPNDQIAELKAVYTHDGIDYTATHSVTVKAQILTEMQIIGPESIMSEKSAEYLFRVKWSNGLWEYVTPTRFFMVPTGYATIEGNKVTANKTTDVDYNITLRAEYSLPGTATSASLNVRLVHVPEPAFLTELMISGATIIQENTGTSYSFLAKYSDGTIRTVTPLTFTSNRPDILTITGNYVEAGSVTRDVQTVLTATFTDGPVAKEATLNLTVLNVVQTVDLVSIRITGPNVVQQSSRVSYKVIATYSDQSQKDITSPDEFKLTTQTNYATVDGLDLIVGSVDVPVVPLTLAATYQENGIRRTTTYAIQLIGSEPVPVSLTIEGQDGIDELTDFVYKARVTMSDTTTKIVPAVWEVVQGKQFATIDQNGKLSAGSVDKNETVLIHATAEGLVAEKTVTIRNVADVALTQAEISELVPPLLFGQNAGETRDLVTTLTFSNGDVRLGVVDELVYRLDPTAAEYLTLTSQGSWKVIVTKDLKDFWGTKELKIEVTATVSGRAVKDTLTIQLIGPTDEVDDVFIKGPDSISEGQSAEYSVFVKRLSGREDEYKTPVPTWVVTNGGAFVDLADGTELWKKKVNVKTGVMEQNENMRLKASDIIVDEKPFAVEKQISLIRDNTLPTKVTLVGPAELQEGQRAAYKLRFEFETGNPVEVQDIIVSYGNDGNEDAVTFNGDNTVTANAVATNQVVQLKGVGELNNKTYTAFLFITVLSSVPTVESLVIMGPAEVRPDTQTQYRCTATYTDGTILEVTDSAVWEVTVTSGGYIVSVDKGLVTVPAGTAEGGMTVKATYETKSGTSTVRIKPEPVNPVYGPRFGSSIERITSEAGFNDAFMQLLDKPLTESGEQFIECPAGGSMWEQNTYFYTAWPASYGYGYFRDYTGGSHGFAGGWDGASQYDDSIEPFANGGIKVEIGGHEYIIYRNDYSFEDNRFVFSILYGSNNPLSGTP